MRFRACELIVDAREALDDRHIAEGVAGVARKRGVVALDGRLQLVGAAQHESRDDIENADHDDEQAGETPIVEERRRQQDEQRDEGGAVLAEEGEPQAEHRGGAFEHRLQEAPGMDVGVKAQRQIQHVIEIARHHDEPGAMREPVGVEPHHHGGDDREEPEPRPGRDGRPDLAQADGRAPGCSLVIRSMMRPKSMGSANCAAARMRLATTSP